MPALQCSNIYCNASWHTTYQHQRRPNTAAKLPIMEMIMSTTTLNHAPVAASVVIHALADALNKALAGLAAKASDANTDGSRFL